MMGSTLPMQGLGCMRLGSGPDDGVAVIHRALDLGATLLDTADLYGDGHNETLVGRALRGRRDQAILCTKFGVVRSLDGALGTRGDAAYVRSACDASLARLDTDTIDLYYLHERHPAVPIEETVGAMARLVEAGKVRRLGLSDVGREDLRAAHAVHPIAALQSQWSLVARAIEEEIVPTSVELGVAVVAYCPQGAGGLTLDRLRRRPPHVPGVAPHLGEIVADVARRHGARPGQVALAWVHHRAPAWAIPVTPIPGTGRLDHLAENVAAADLVLDPDDLARLDAAG